MPKTPELLYAVVGAGDFAVSKAKDLTDRKMTARTYKDMVKRGRTLSTKIKRSAPTKQATAQTKAARSQARPQQPARPKPCAPTQKPPGPPPTRARDQTVELRALGTRARLRWARRLSSGS